MLRTSWMAVAGLIVALALTVRVEEHRLDRAERRAQALALQAVNVAAERDSTRNVATTSRRIAELLGDSLRVAERLVVQGAQRADALDRALGRERKARYQMVAAVDSLSRAAANAAVVQGSDEVRRARFDVRQAPYTIDADVAIPAPPDSARMAIDVALDAIPVDLRVGCGTPDRHGIRAATVDAVSPQWATVRLERLEQLPEVCASPAVSASAKRGERQFAFTPLTAGFGRALSLDGRWSWALFLGGGFSSW
ncbi:MAG TPA: hypothetical protein VFY85_01100 [Gemmatimonadaceae bacterium]|nr:hypothetical protein [Gemmatimonadaceae bacterium]